MSSYPYPDQRGIIQEIFELLVDTCCSSAKTIRISGEDKPADAVKNRFMQFDMSHVEYILDSWKRNASDVRNIKQYMLATLYNAPMTVNSYYSAKYHHMMLDASD